MKIEMKRLVCGINKNLGDVWFEKLYLDSIASRRGASDNITDSSVLSDLADTQNVSCLGLCGRDIYLKNSA